MMLEFTVLKKPLEDAMKIAFLSTEAVENLITGHCLFDVNNQVLKILATDKKSRLSKTVINIASDQTIRFTADPRKILKLLRTVETDSLKFGFDKETNTLQIFLSDNDESFVSLPSFEPSTYAPIEESFEKAFDLKTLNAGVFLGGIQFIKGFLLDKDKRFSNMFISNGIMYGANGNNKASAFSSPELESLNELVFPITTFPAIANLISTLDLKDIIISSSSNHIFISSPNKDYIFGFTKVQLKMPKIPITVDEPESNGWKVNRNTMIKKLSRLHLTGDAKLGVRFILGDDKVQLSTVIDRPSKDTVACTRIKGDTEANCITEVRLMESALSQFGGEEIEIYATKGKLIIYSKAQLEVTDGNIKVMKPFISSAAVALSQEE